MESLETKDLLKDIVKKADTLTLQEIKENWEIVGIIAHKKETLQKQLNSYKSDIADSQAILKDLRAKEAELKDTLNELTTKKYEVSEELSRLRDELSVQKVINNAKRAKLDLQETRKQILPGALRSVQIYLKDGSIAKAKPAQKIFSEDIYKKYRVELKENHILKTKISELELENKRLNIELRDFYAELALEGMGALESKDNKETSQEDTKIRESREIIITNEDLSDFKKMLKATKEKRTRSRKTKE